MLYLMITHTPDSPTYRKADLDIPDETMGHYGDFRPTEEVFDAWERTRKIATLLEAPLVVFQCPASFTPTAEHMDNMRAFFEEVDRGDLVFAWEPRGEWEDDVIVALCQDLGLVHCVDPFQLQPATEELAYFRLHGIDGYYYNYTEEDLEQLVEWCAPFDRAYVLFNNVSMWEGGLRFQEMIPEA